MNILYTQNQNYLENSKNNFDNIILNILDIYRNMKSFNSKSKKINRIASSNFSIWLYFYISSRKKMV